MATCATCGASDLLSSDIVADHYCVYCYDVDEIVCNKCHGAEYVVDTYYNGTKECPNCGHMLCAHCGKTEEYWHLVEKRPEQSRDLYECDCYNRILKPR